MTKFLKLTKLILNTNDIQKINIKPNKFYIHFIGKQFSGFMWQFGGYGIGSISTDNFEIEVCETLNPDDYKIVSEWINNII
jgi:hypothetical protein